jgi:hypothetical protein
MAARTKLILWMEVVRPVLYFLGSLMLGATVEWFGAGALGSHPPLPEILIGGVAIVTVLAGLWCFWLLADGVEFVRLHYRIQHLPPREYWRWTPGPKACVYEEWSLENGIRQIPFVRDILGPGYPAPSIIRFPSDTAGAAQTPDSARGRRAEIIARIRQCAGENTRFAESEPASESLRSTSDAGTPG